MKKRLPLIIFLLLVIACGVIYYFHLQSQKVKLNDTYVNGNSAGNLYNAGLFCESNGVIFFSNPDDQGRLYRMDPDGKNVEKLCDDTVMYINADDNYIYYVRDNTHGGTGDDFFSYNNNSLCRINREGGKVTILDEDPCIYASLIGNYIYYLHYDDETATTLYRVKIDGSEREQVLDYYIFTCSSLGQYFYYNGNQTDGNIYRYDTRTGSSSSVYACDAYKPIVTSDSNVFYIDVDHDYRLVHTNMTADNPILLTSDSVDCYNVYGSSIYYQTNDGNTDDSTLCMVKNGGTGQTVIANGTYTTINVTSHYIYFKDFFTDTWYYTSTSNPGTPIIFQPGIDED